MRQDQLTEFAAIKQELTRVLTLMAMQLAIADQVVAENMPRAFQLLQQLKNIIVQTDGNPTQRNQ